MSLIVEIASSGTGVAVRVANEELPDVLGVRPIIAFRFDVSLPGAAEAVEIIDEIAAHEGLQCLINRGEIDSLLDDFVAIDIDENLRHVRLKCWNERAELGTLARGVQKRFHVLREKRHVLPGAILEDKSEPARCADARNRRRRKSKSDPFAETRRGIC